MRIYKDGKTWVVDGDVPQGFTLRVNSGPIRITGILHGSIVVLAQDDPDYGYPARLVWDGDCRCCSERNKGTCPQHGDKERAIDGLDEDGIPYGPGMSGGCVVQVIEGKLIRIRCSGEGGNGSSGSDEDNGVDATPLVPRREGGQGEPDRET